MKQYSQKEREEHLLFMGSRTSKKRYPNKMSGGSVSHRRPKAEEAEARGSRVRNNQNIFA